MAWNQPGSGQKPGGDNQDPWGRRPSAGGGGKGGNNVLDKLQGMFGGGDPQSEKQLTRLLLVGAVGLWAIFGFYRVEQAERAVLLRFGEFQSVQTAGLHWHPPLVDSLRKVNVERTEQMPLNASMITEDENIVDISLSVQYRIADARLYVLAVADPQSTLAHATESALRHVVGSAKMAQVLGEGRAKLAQDMQPRLQAYLDLYKTGLSVRNVNILEALPPRDVKSAFDDVIRAKEDKERLKNQAETYANGIVPEARGQAARLVADASAYKQEVVDRASGDASRFKGLLGEYRQNPSVMKSRLYLETMESVLGKTSKIVVEPNGAAPLLYLPMDKLGQGGAPAAEVLSGQGQVIPPAATGGSREAARTTRNLEEAR
ncbi:FtsH protease activity modulator HflK [Amnimonas aquatica]|uniref:Protein HflK n=1 Tax=Amnimonas aquatica TaxID=2094561 RepID=A0A2P6AU94_9GAMM|nr:FtsH protease activity modulator HflK [Amnimonas aquatica]PQA49455.1 FtsH protease activity modulator HflK [Amnimonas aquatica]